MSILKAISTEVHENVSGGIHPSVSALVDAFIVYLKEPRYSNPLGLAELSQLFANFYADLNSLVIYIYTQSNSNKRQLLQNSAIFQNDQKTFDYLVALSQYSTSSIKRSPASDRKDQTPQNLNLPLSSFCESQNDAEAAKLDEYFLTLDTSECATLQEIKKNFKLLNIVKTPSTKLKYLVNTQKLIVRLLSNFYNDASKVNNDILLPALIYIIIYHLPEDVPENPELETVTESYDLLLNITFIKNFLNVIDAHKVDITTFTLNTSLSSYKPTGKKRPFSRGDRRNSSTNLYDLINLKESAECEPVDDDEGNSIYSTKGLQNDKALIDYIQKNFLNHGELQYYLTNFEAVIYFLSNSTLDELVPDGFSIPESSRDHKLVTKPLHKILEEEFASAAMKDKSDVDADKLSRTLDEELDANRSRSGSLFNTISSAVQSSVNRSRSNSGAIKSNKESNGHNDFENSLYGGPLGNYEAYGFGRMKNILGKLGSSAIQFRQGFEEELNSGMLSDPQVNETRQKRASTLSINSHQIIPECGSSHLMRWATAVTPGPYTFTQTNPLAEILNSSV
ncbi:hypothetical protein CJJ09_001933 [Candidozyma auris]|nr:hypothetical protein CJJ09_001933 [[Candida] auris]